MAFLFSFFQTCLRVVWEDFMRFFNPSQESHFREELNVSFIALILKKSDASDVRDLSVCLVVLMKS
jgi:hypothetical protein